MDFLFCKHFSFVVAKVLDFLRNLHLGYFPVLPESFIRH